MPVFRTNKGNVALKRHYTRRGPTGPKGPAGTARIGDTNLPASEAIKGLLRYREPGSGGSVLSMCMRRVDGTYGWTDLVEEI